MTLEEMQQLIERHRKRVGVSKYVEAKIELSQELYPLLSSLVEAFDERMREVEMQLISLIEATSSVIQPDLAAQILSTLGIAKELVTAIEASADTTALCVALLESIQLTEESVLAVTIEEGEAEDEDEDEEKEEEAKMDEVAPKEPQQQPQQPQATVVPIMEQK